MHPLSILNSLCCSHELQEIQDLLLKELCDPVLYHKDYYVFRNTSSVLLLAEFCRHHTRPFYCTSQLKCLAHRKTYNRQWWIVFFQFHAGTQVRAESWHSCNFADEMPCRTCWQKHHYHRVCTCILLLWCEYGFFSFVQFQVIEIMLNVVTMIQVALITHW